MQQPMTLRRRPLVIVCAIVLATLTTMVLVRSTSVALAGATLAGYASAVAATSAGSWLSSRLFAARSPSHVVTGYLEFVICRVPECGDWRHQARVALRSGTVVVVAVGYFAATRDGGGWAIYHRPAALLAVAVPMVALYIAAGYLLVETVPTDNELARFDAAPTTRRVLLGAIGCALSAGLLAAIDVSAATAGPSAAFWAACSAGITVTVVGPAVLALVLLVMLTAAAGCEASTGFGQYLELARAAHPESAVDTTLDGDDHA